MKLLYFCLLACTLFTACGPRTHTSNDTTEEESLSIDNSDSIKKSQEMLNDTTPLSFGSAEDAIQYMKSTPEWEKYSKGILPRMARESLSYATKLLNNKYDYFIIVDKSIMKVILYNKYGEVVKQYGMACAKNYGTKMKKADSRTPDGFFSAEGIYDSTDWLYTNDWGETSPVRGQFGPRFIRLKCPNTTQIGIHGTGSPWSIGKRVSHGCIRLTNENILDLVKYAKVGMPIIVNPSPSDMAVNKREGNNIPSITSLPDGVKPEPNNYVAPVSTVKPKPETSDSTLNQNSESDDVPEVRETVPSSEPLQPTEQNSEE